jgi:hypothetical protein
MTRILLLLFALSMCSCKDVRFHAGEYAKLKLTGQIVLITRYDPIDSTVWVKRVDKSGQIVGDYVSDCELETVKQ